MKYEKDELPWAYLEWKEIGPIGDIWVMLDGERIAHLAYTNMTYEKNAQENGKVTLTLLSDGNAAGKTMDFKKVLKKPNDN